MSFLELWDSFEAVKDHWHENKSLTESFSELIKLRVELEKSAIKRLDKIIQLPFFQLGKNTVAPAIEKLHSIYSQKLLSSKGFITSVQQEILTPVRDLLHGQDLRIKEKGETCKKLESEKKKLVKSLEISKEKYWNYCKSNLLEGKFKKEHHNKENSSLENYLHQIDAVNRYNMKFREDMGRHLITYQAAEEELYNLLKQSFSKLNDSENTLATSLLSEMSGFSIVRLRQAINVLNPNTEIFMFVDELKTEGKNQIFSFEASPYGSIYPIPEVRTSTTDVFYQKILIICWEGLIFPEEDFKHFESTIASADSRKSFLYFLNERRIKSLFQIPNNGFDCMSKILMSLLDSIEADHDEHAAKLTIVLSQTFYTEKSNEKIYLHTGISGHQVWAKETMWQGMIEDGIQKELQNYAQFCDEETSEEHKEKISSILVSQLSSYIHIMKTFSISLEFIKGVSENLVNRYGLKDLNLNDFYDF